MTSPPNPKLYHFSLVVLKVFFFGYDKEFAVEVESSSCNSNSFMLAIVNKSHNILKLHLDNWCGQGELTSARPKYLVVDGKWVTVMERNNIIMRSYYSIKQAKQRDTFFMVSFFKNHYYYWWIWDSLKETYPCPLT